MLKSITKGKVKKPLLMCLYGTEGVGKTTFASKSDAPIFVGPESGNDNLDVSRFPTPKGWTELLAQLDALINEKHDFKTLVIDSLDWCERLLHNELTEQFKAKSIEDIGGGYGRYVSIVNNEWSRLIESTRILREKNGMSIIMIAHYMVKTFTDPMTSSPYDRYQMKLLDKSSALFREYVDIMAFATFEVACKAEGTASKGKAKGEGFRIMYTEKRPSHDAKNRFSMPYIIAFDYDEFKKEMDASNPDKLKEINKEINDMLIDIKDTDLVAKVNQTLKKSTDNYQQLLAIKNRLMVLTNGSK